MPHWLDEFIIVRTAVFARGWSERQPVRLLLDGEDLGAEAVIEDRQDLIPHFGPHARDWGFRLRAFVDCDRPHRRLAIRLGDEVITADRFIAENEKASGALLPEFAARMNSGGRRLLEIGSRARSGVVRRDLFNNCGYVGLDVLDGPNVDVVGDTHFLDRHFGPEEFDGVTSSSVFEHLLMPWKAVLEINRVLKPGGLVYTQSHQTWPLHDAPWDFFRFSDGAWTALFNEASGFRILAAEQGEPAAITPVLQGSGNDVTRMDYERGYLRSVCLAEKIGPAKVAFPLDETMFRRILAGREYPDGTVPNPFAR